MALSKKIILITSLTLFVLILFIGVFHFLSKKDNLSNRAVGVKDLRVQQLKKEQEKASTIQFVNGLGFSETEGISTFGDYENGITYFDLIGKLANISKQGQNYITKLQVRTNGLTKIVLVNLGTGETPITYSWTDLDTENHSTTVFREDDSVVTEYNEKLSAKEVYEHFRNNTDVYFKFRVALTYPAKQPGCNTNCELVYDNFNEYELSNNDFYKAFSNLENNVEIGSILKIYRSK